MINAAGILFQTPDGRILFLKRSGDVDQPGMWAFPGGKLEDGETAEQAAIRETAEEIGVDVMKGKAFSPPVELVRRQKDDVDFTTFKVRVEESFSPRLNDEHDEFIWAQPDDPPAPLHPGARVAVQRLKMDELGVAKAMAVGDLTSPQRYQNMSLFAMRITGTGVAYRKGIDEFVWRDPSIYLNDEFLARCAGLPVIVEHPLQNALDSKEFQDRVVGTVLLPYLEGNEVWGIAKIFDDATIEMLETHKLSTSPAVVFADPNSTRSKRLDDGSTLLIEGKPSLLDHLAICEQGVWDKGGEPAGVKSTLNNEDTTMPDENLPVDTAKADADAGEKLDKLLTAIDSMSTRMDAFESKMAKPDAAPTPPVNPPAPAAKSDAGGDEYPEEISSMPEETAADKMRKDSAKTGWKADKARKDAEAKSAEEAAAAKARDDADTRRRIDELESKLPATMSDADVAEMSEAQAKADSVYAAHSSAAPRAMQGETLLSYRRRLARGVQSHSAAWKGIDLGKLDGDALGIAEQQIFADAIAASRNPVDLPEGELREIRSTDVTGRIATTFVGQPRSWMSSFSANRRRLAGIKNGSH